MDAMKINRLPLFFRKRDRHSRSRMIFLELLIFLLIIGFSCTDKNRQEPEPVELSWDFNPGHEGWSGDFAGYPMGEEDAYELLFEHDTLPLPLDQEQHSLKLSGNNLNGHLFMFAKKRLTSLEPNAVYFITFTAEFATGMPGDSTSTDSPGAKVFVAAGATPSEPLKVTGENNMYDMNIGKCNLEQNGEDMVVLGDFTNGIDRPEYVLKSFENENPFRCTTNDKGELWVIIGIDSGWPAPITAYLNAVTVKLF